MVNAECVFCSGGLGRASRLSDGEWDLGAGRGGEFWTGLRSAKQAGRVRTSEQLLQLHHEHNTRTPAVWQSQSTVVWEDCRAALLPLYSTHPASAMRVFLFLNTGYQGGQVPVSRK